VKLEGISVSGTSVFPSLTSSHTPYPRRLDPIWIRNYVNFGDKVGDGEYMNFGGNCERAATAVVLTDIMQY